MDIMDKPVETDGAYDLSCWFSLTYASWLTLPRVLMEAMSDEWQGKMATLLNEYDSVYSNLSDLGLGTRVQVTKEKKLIKTPPEFLQYRHSDREWLAELKEKK